MIFKKNIFRSSRIYGEAGFIIGYLRLGELRVNDCPARLEPPAEARNRRKPTEKKRRNTAPPFIRLDPNILPRTKEIRVRHKQMRTL